MTAGDILPVGVHVTLPEALSAGSGFEHAAFGKWHLDGMTPDPSNPIAHGFSKYVGALNNLGSGMSLRFCDSNGTLCVAGNNTDCSACGSGNCTGGFRDDDYYHWPKVENEIAAVFPPCAVETPLDNTAYATTEESEQAKNWILNEVVGQDWFAWLAFHAPHGPYQVPPEDLVNDPLYSFGLVCAESDANRRLCYKWMIEAIDTKIEDLLAVDDDLSDTTVIFVGDNGTDAAVATDPPFVSSRAKGTVYEGGINVPLIISGAAIDPSHQGSTSAAMVHTVDIFATVLELAGAGIPSGVDSVSLVPVLDSPSASVRAFVMSEVAGPKRAIRFDSPGGPSAYKLIRQDDFDELYNLNADPFEDSDLNTGRCSGNPATGCLDDADCTPLTQPCVLPPPLGTGERDALYDLQVELCSLVMRNMPPAEACPGGFSAPVTCGSCGSTECVVQMNPSQQSVCQLDTDSRFCCPSGQFVHRENCQCGTGALCPAASQRLFCK